MNNANTLTKKISNEPSNEIRKNSILKERVNMMKFNPVQPMASDKSNHTFQYSNKRNINCIKILIADDHDLVREAIGAMLTNVEDAVVDLAADLKDALHVIKSAGPFDLIILDYDMPGMDGLNGLKQVIKLVDGCPVALLSGTTSNEIANQALKFGAAGFLPKTLSTRSMVAAVNFMIAGEIYAPIDVLKRQTHSSDKLLSDREIEVLTGICKGKSNKEIARDLDLKEVTIKLHAKTLSQKLKARNRTHAAMIARDKKII